MYAHCDTISDYIWECVVQVIFQVSLTVLTCCCLRVLQVIFQVSLAVHTCCCLRVLQVIFQVSLAVLDNNKERLARVSDDGEAMAILAHYLDTITNPHATVASSSTGTSAAGAFAANFTHLVQDSVRLVPIPVVGYGRILMYKCIPVLKSTC